SLSASPTQRTSLSRSGAVVFAHKPRSRTFFHRIFVIGNRNSTSRQRVDESGTATPRSASRWAASLAALATSPRHDLNRSRASGVRPSRMTTLRSEEHTSELQSRENLVCRLLLEK